MNKKHIIFSILFVSVVSTQIIVCVEVQSDLIHKAQKTYDTLKRDIKRLLSKQPCTHTQKLRLFEQGALVTSIGIMLMCVGIGGVRLIQRWTKDSETAQDPKDSEDVHGSEVQGEPEELHEPKIQDNQPKSILKKPGSTKKEERVHFSEDVKTFKLLKIDDDKLKNDFEAVNVEFKKLDKEARYGAIRKVTSQFQLRERRIIKEDKEIIEDLIEKLWDAKEERPMRHCYVGALMYMNALIEIEE